MVSFQTSGVWVWRILVFQGLSVKLSGASCLRPWFELKIHSRGLVMKKTWFQGLLFKCVRTVMLIFQSFRVISANDDISAVLRHITRWTEIWGLEFVNLRVERWSVPLGLLGRWHVGLAWVSGRWNRSGIWSLNLLRQNLCSLWTFPRVKIRRP